MALAQAHGVANPARVGRVGQDFTVWQPDNHPIIIETEERMQKILAYIHLNPVRAGWVKYPEEYIYSSASQYTDNTGILEIDLIALYGYR